MVAAKLVLATTNATYFRAWSKAMQGSHLYSNDESEALQRAMTVGTTTASTLRAKCCSHLR
jgi:hypothetical protein